MSKKFDTITVPHSGSVSDYNMMNIPKHSFTYCLNGAMEAKSQDGQFDSIQNDGSNLLAINFPSDMAVIGKIRVHEQGRTIYMLVNPVTGASEIGEALDCVYNDDKDDFPSGVSGCEDCIFPVEIERTPLEQIEQVPYCSYRTITSNPCLGFNINYPIRIRYKITDCSLNIYFTDKLNERRYLYFDYNSDNTLRIQDRFKVTIGFDPNNCDQPIHADLLDCDKLLYHPKYDAPCFDLVDVVSGGSLKAGAYQFLAAYTDVNGNPLSDFVPASNPIPIFVKQITFETNYITDKAIVLKVNNIELNSIFSYYTVVVAETIDNFTEFKRLGIFPITQSLVKYTGDEVLDKLTPEDVFFTRVYYKTAGNIANANDYLFFSDLEEFDIPNFQRVANDIKLYWATIAVSEGFYKNPKATFRYRTLARDEVYAEGVIFEMDNGKEYGPYHIPGPSKEYLLDNYGLDVDEVISNDDVLIDINCTDQPRNKKWQVYNTAFAVGTPHAHSEDSKECLIHPLWEWGECSYWESTLTYPDDPVIWGELCGKPIRHHKMPDSIVTHIHDSENGNKTYSDSNIIYPLGMRVDHNSVVLALDNAVANGIISQQDRNRIVRYRIVRGNRVGNESVICVGYFFDMWNYTKNNVKYYYPNYPYNDLRDDPFIANTPNTYNGSNTSSPIRSHFEPTKRYTFHSPDIHFKNPTIGTEIKLETLEYGKAEGYFNHCEEQAKYKFLSTAAMLLTLAAGVATAFSLEKEKECKVVVTKSMQAIEGTLPGAITTIPGIPGVNYIPLSLSDIPGAMLYDDFTGQPIIPVFDPAVVTEVQRQTCHGRPFQLLSPFSGNPAGAFLQQLVYMGVISLREMQILIDLLKSLIPEKNFAVQYNSIGKYVNYKTVDNTGSKIRKIERSAYLEPMVQLINEAINTATTTFSNVYINNWNRERSVYLKTDIGKPAFPAPSVQDTSRFTMNDVGFQQEDLFKRFYSNISSYYGSIKRYVPDQYGSIGSIEYVETDSCYFNLSKLYNIEETTVFGGDKFIGRFGLKRKMPFFLQTRFRQQNESDVEYSELGNVGYPNYYFNAEATLIERIGNLSFSISNIFSGALFQSLLGVARTRLDARKNKLFYQSGFIHLYNYGIPYFLVESDVNLDYRYGENNVEKDFYPHQQDLDFWFQEKNVPITEDNYYFYNKTYSKQNKESFIGTERTDVDLRPCKVAHPSRVINSVQGINDNRIDNWLMFRPNDFFDFPLSNGRIIGLDGIESDKVLVRFENTAKIFNAYDVLSTEFKDVQIGNAGLFATRPKEFTSTTLGYAGSQHTDILLTEFGHIWTDAKRGQILNLAPNGTALNDIVDEDVRNWFGENLPFQIKKDFPNIDPQNIDNSFKGIGISLSFDKRFNRIFITKLDYKKIHIGVSYDPITKDFYVDDNKVSLTDKRYFCNKSWTASYNFKTKNWIYHSFTPNYYIPNIDYFDAGWNFDSLGLVDAKLWSHNLTNKSYQVYCGKLYPFIVEIPSDPMIENGILNSVKFDTDALRYHNQFDYIYDRTMTFNKAWIYNDRQCTGELELVVRNEDDLATSISYPKVENGVQKLLITNLNNQWTFNQFWDVVNTQLGNLPFILNKCNNAEKVLYLKAFNYFKPDVNKQPIRGKQTRIRLIADKDSNKKLILHFVLHDRTKDEF